MAIRKLLLIVPLVAVALTAAYGYTVTRRERNYRQLVIDGDYALARGDSYSAVGAFTHAIDLKPDSMVAYLKRGDAHRRRGDLHSAAADLERAAQLDPSAPRVFELLGDVEAERDRPERAAERYESSLRLDDRSPRVLYKLALARHVAGRTDEAAEALRTAVTLDRRFAEAHYLLGVCLRELKRPREAEASLRSAIEAAPTLHAAREQLAELYADLGRRADRITQLERLLAGDPGPARHVALAMAAAEAGDTARAVRQLETASELYPDHAGIHLGLGRVWLRAGAAGHAAAATRAADALQRAVGLEGSSSALLELGRARLAAGDPAGAERALRQATAVLPIEPRAYVILADASDRAGHRQAARRALRAYGRLVPPWPAPAIDAAAEAGDVAMRIGEARLAAEWYAAAAAAGRPTTGLLVRLAEAQLRSGQAAAARSTLLRVLDAEPGHTAAEALLRKVPG